MFNPVWPRCNKGLRKWLNTKDLKSNLFHMGLNIYLYLPVPVKSSQIHVYTVLWRVYTEYCLTSLLYKWYWVFIPKAIFLPYIYIYINIYSILMYAWTNTPVNLSRGEFGWLENMLSSSLSMWLFDLTLTGQVVSSCVRLWTVSRVVLTANVDVCGGWGWGVGGIQSRSDTGLSCKRAKVLWVEKPHQKIWVCVYDRVKCKNLYLSVVFLVQQACMLQTRELILNKWIFKTYPMPIFSCPVINDWEKAAYCKVQTTQSESSFSFALCERHN